MSVGAERPDQSAVVTDGEGSVWLEDRDVPTPEHGEALVRIRAVGVCGTDIGLIEGEGPPWTNYPVVLGHEVCAEVVEVGPGVTDLTVGDRVALHGFLYCGTCTACRDGRYYQCDELREIGMSLDGGYRTYATWPTYTLTRIPEEIPDAAATQIDTAACMLHALQRAELSTDDTAAVLGPGPLGLFGVQLLQAKGIDDIAVTGLLDERLAVAEQLGATHTINASETDPVAELEAYSEGEGIDVCVEAAGAGDVVNTCFQAAAPQGQVVLAGVFDGQRSIYPNDVVIKELSVVGGVTAAHAVDPVIDLFERGDLSADEIVTHEFPLTEFETALETVRAREDGVIKAVLRP